MSLPEHVALVTGASGGIGSAVALRLSREGAAIVVHYGQNGDGAERTCRLIAEAGGTATAQQAPTPPAARGRKGRGRPSPGMETNSPFLRSRPATSRAPARSMNECSSHTL